jgi:hypothetical protein
MVAEESSGRPPTAEVGVDSKPESENPLSAPDICPYSAEYNVSSKFHPQSAHINLTTMLASAKSESPQAARTLVRSLGYDFAILGLKAHESRVEVIREAAATTASRIQRAFPETPADRDSLLSDLATSTYRLLDPRRRGKTMERIQLSLLSESDLDRQQLAREPLFPSTRVRAELVETDEHQLRSAKREIVQLLMERSVVSHRVGAVTTSLLGALGMVVLVLWLLVSA